MKLRIENPGVLSTIQDRGRYGYMKAGVRTAGVMDTDSYQTANAVLVNAPDAAVVEMTLMGMTAIVEEEGFLTLTGAEMNGTLDGIPFLRNQKIHARKGQRLAMGMASSGCRGYLALEGGIDVPRVMGSRSTDVKCRIGGVEGRALRAGDVLCSGEERLQEPAATAAGGSGKDGGQRIPAQQESYAKRPPVYETSVRVRVVEGPQADWFSEEERDRFFAEAYTVAAESDRMGMRLKGRPVESLHGVDIVSDGIAFGSIQITKSGMPIIMMADHQTIGGYAKIGTVCSFDLPKLAQLRPGDQVSFCRISVEEAQNLYCHPQERNRTAPLACLGRKTIREEGCHRHRFQKTVYYYRHR